MIQTPGSGRSLWQRSSTLFRISFLKSRCVQKYTDQVRVQMAEESAKSRKNPAEGLVTNTNINHVNVDLVHHYVLTQVVPIHNSLYICAIPQMCIPNHIPPPSTHIYILKCRSNNSRCFVSYEMLSKPGTSLWRGWDGSDSPLYEKR